MGNVFQNVEEITTVIPFGKFFRQFHYASGQLFVILMLVHTVDYFLKRRYRTYSPKEWTLLILSLYLCFFTLFTGFILKGDKEGLFAGNIFMSIAKTVPFVGDPVSRLLIVPGKSFFFLPYLHHCLLLPLLIIYLIRAHIREWLPDQRFLFSATVGIFLYALLVDPFMDIPPEAPVELVTGPWFFLGIQSLLKVAPPLWGGLVIPGIFAVCLLMLPFSRNVSGRVLHYFVMATFCGYGLLTLRAFLVGP